MVEHILLAHQVSAETDLTVIEKAISFLLKEDEACKLLASDDYIALRKDAISDLPSKCAVLFNSLKISIHPSKDRRIKDCTITLSLIKPKIQMTIGSRCSKTSDTFQRMPLEVAEGDACH
jgi:hypothetical protein